MEEVDAGAWAAAVMHAVQAGKEECVDADFTIRDMWVEPPQDDGHHYLCVVLDNPFEATRLLGYRFQLNAGDLTYLRRCDNRLDVAIDFEVGAILGELSEPPGTGYDRRSAPDERGVPWMHCY